MQAYMVCWLSEVLWIFKPNRGIVPHIEYILCNTCYIGLVPATYLSLRKYTIQRKLIKNLQGVLYAKLCCTQLWCCFQHQSSVQGVIATFTFLLLLLLKMQCAPTCIQYTKYSSMATLDLLKGFQDILPLTFALYSVLRMSSVWILF